MNGLHVACCCRREVLAPLQQAEAIDIRRKSDAFGEKVEDFRKFFQQKAPFSVPGGELKLEHVRDWTQLLALSALLAFAILHYLPYHGCFLDRQWST